MNGTSAGALLQLVRSGQARTRAALQAVTGLSRSTVAQRLELLVRAGYLTSAGVGPSTGGRPAAVLELDTAGGVILAADLGAKHARLAVTDLAGSALVERQWDLEISAGPVEVLDWLSRQFRTLLPKAGASVSSVRGLGVGVPGPVEFTAGRVVQPPIMPGWDDYPIVEHLRKRFDVPVVVDNDANLMALGEHVTHHRSTPALLLVKISTGIGAGVVIDGSVFRGIDGGAGDIGHVRMAGYDDARCMCGSTGCLAAMASGGALAQRLTALGIPTASSREVLRRLLAGESEPLRLAREAGQLVGDVLATVVCVLNPGVLLIGGDLAESHFVAGVREVLYRRALPRATRHLQVTTSTLGERAAVVGAATLVAETIYAPAAVDAALAASS